MFDCNIHHIIWVLFTLHRNKEISALKLDSDDGYLLSLAWTPHLSSRATFFSYSLLSFICGVLLALQTHL